MAFSRIGIFAKQEEGAVEIYHLVHGAGKGYYQRNLHQDLETLFSNLNAFFPRERLTKIRIERTNREYDMAVFYQNIFNKENKWVFTTLLIESIDKELPACVNGLEEQILTKLTDYVIGEGILRKPRIDPKVIGTFVRFKTHFPDIVDRRRELLIPENNDVAAAEWFLTICSEEGYPLLFQSYVNGVPTELIPNMPQNLKPRQKREFYIMFISGLASSFIQFYDYGYFIRDFVLNDRSLIFDRIPMGERIEEITYEVEGKTELIEKKVAIYFPVCLEFRNVNPSGLHFGLLGNERQVLRAITRIGSKILQDLNIEEVFNQKIREEEMIPFQARVDAIIDESFDALEIRQKIRDLRETP